MFGGGHDGSLRCLLCRDSSPVADHEWCSAARALVCETCCRRLVSGDAGALIGGMTDESQAIALIDMVAACAECPRLLHRIAERTLVDEYSPGPAN